MKATLFYSLRRFRGSVLGWGLGLFLLGFGAASAYPMVQQQAELLGELLDNLPEAITAFIGDTNQAFTPEGLLHGRFFMLTPIILGVFAALAGSGLLVHDEETGRLDLIAAHPLSRAAIFFGRLTGLLLATAGILAIGWLGLAVGIWTVSIPLSAIALTPAMLSLFAVLALTEGLALLLSMLLPARRYAGMTAGLVVVASFFITGFSELNDSLKPLARMLPLYYYQGGRAIGEFNWLYFVGLLVAAGVCFAVSYWRFEARDIRVAGEGTWQWRKVGAIAGASLAVVVICIVAGSLRTRHDSPQEAFDAAVTALHDEDWESFPSCLTADSMDEWNGAMVLFASLLEAGFEQQNPSEALKRADRQFSKEQLKAMAEAVTKLQRAMIHVDREALKQRRDKLHPAAIAALFTGSIEVNEQTRELARLVKEPQEFLPKALEAWSAIFRYRDVPKMENLQVDAQTARAVMIMPDGKRREIAFERINGGWRVALPFFVGQRPTAVVPNRPLAAGI